MPPPTRPRSAAPCIPPRLPSNSSAARHCMMRNESVAPFTVSNELLNDPPALHSRMAADGYLFFHGLGPKERILAARRDVLALCQNTGWCDAEGKWSGAG